MGSMEWEYAPVVAVNAKVNNVDGADAYTTTIRSNKFVKK